MPTIKVSITDLKTAIGKAEKKAAAKLAKEAKNEERTDIIRTICENLGQSSNVSVEVTA